MSHFNTEAVRKLTDIARSDVMRWLGKWVEPGSVISNEINKIFRRYCDGVVEALPHGDPRPPCGSLSSLIERSMKESGPKSPHVLVPKALWEKTLACEAFSREQCSGLLALMRWFEENHVLNAEIVDQAARATNSDGQSVLLLGKLEAKIAELEARVEQLAIPAVAAAVPDNRLDPER